MGMVRCMKLQINNETYDIVVARKKTTKNIYVRVKEDFTVFVTCHSSTPDQKIEEVIKENYQSIVKMIETMKRKQKYNSEFYFLGKRYDIVYTEFCDIKLGEDKVFMRHDFDLDKWKKKQALQIFQEHLNRCYEKFSRNIPRPTLRIRSMKSRWGVCNVKTKVITLNTELIMKDLGCLDYVIFHELSHLVEANHSKRFWQVVEENCPDYKRYRKLTNALGEE